MPASGGLEFQILVRIVGLCNTLDGHLGPVWTGLSSSGSQNTHEARRHRWNTSDVHMNQTWASRVAFVCGWPHKMIALLVAEPGRKYTY